MDKSAPMTALSVLGICLLVGSAWGELISFDSRASWGTWDLPAGAVEVTPSGRLQLVPVRKGVNAAEDADQFGGGIRAVGSNAGQAPLLMDGDPATAWHPRDADIHEDWWVEVDLGRLVTADEVRIQLAPDAPPLEFFRVLISNGEPSFTNALVPIEGSLVYGKSQRYGFNTAHELAIPLDHEPVRVIRLEALERTPGAGIAEISVSTPGDNIALGLIERGGHIELITDQQQILSGAERIADGDLVTFWAMTTYHQTEVEGKEVFNRIIFDLGAHYWADRVFIVGDPVGAPTARRRSFNNFFWYRLSASDGSLAPDGSLRWEEIAFQPHLSENLNEKRRFDHRFGLRRIRYLRQLFPSSQGGQRAPGQRFGLISEFQIYGEGYPAEVLLASPLIDLDGFANITAVSWEADQPPGTRLEVRSRTGNQVIEEQHYFDKKGKEITQRKWEKTPKTLRGPVEVTQDIGTDWSNWSEPYVVSGAQFLSPSPRRYVQLQIRVITDDHLVAPTLSALHLDVSDPMAVEARGEIYPSLAQAGQMQDFTYFLRPRYDGSSQGVDRLQLVASVPIEFVGVQVGGQAVDGRVQTHPDGFAVALPQTVPSDALVQLAFRSTIYRNQTRFDLFLGNSSLGEAVRQRVDAGDASDAVASETVAIRLPVTSELLSNFTLSSPIITPNGDGVSDRLDIAFDLLKVLTPRPVRAAIYDLAGRPVKHLDLAAATAGRHTLSWDGRDADTRLVPPGTYLLRLSIEGDAHTQVIDRVLAVAY